MYTVLAMYCMYCTGVKSALQLLCGNVRRHQLRRVPRQHHQLPRVEALISASAKDFLIITSSVVVV